MELYASSYRPDPRRALDVLAFLLTPISAFAADEDEREAVAELLGVAKREALERWDTLRRVDLQN